MELDQSGNSLWQGGISGTTPPDGANSGAGIGVSGNYAYVAGTTSWYDMPNSNVSGLWGGNEATYTTSIYSDQIGGLLGDANLDGKVDINDLTIVLAHYNQTGMTWTDGEFTGSGTVDINDLTIVLANYGQTLAAAERLFPNLRASPLRHSYSLA